MPDFTFSNPPAKPSYANAYEAAVQLLEMSPELEIRSALKQAGSDAGIPYGRDMATFVVWAEREMVG